MAEVLDVGRRTIKDLDLAVLVSAQRLPTTPAILDHSNHLQLRDDAWDTGPRAEDRCRMDRLLTKGVVEAGNGELAARKATLNISQSS